MRLIDADALKEIIGECPENWTDSPEEVAEFNMWHRIMDDIDSTSTALRTGCRRPGNTSLRIVKLDYSADAKNIMYAKHIMRRLTQ